MRVFVFTLYCLCLTAVGTPLFARTDELIAKRARGGPMQTEGLERRLAHILDRYYEQTWSSLENWERLQSVKMKGTLELAQGILSFEAFKKKPDLCKIVLGGATRNEMILAYDGSEAWQKVSASGKGPVTMVRGEARNFIRDASFSGHLFYPQAEGKRIELLGTRSVEDQLCFDLQVTLPDGQVVLYAIRASDFIERQQILVNVVNGQREVTTHLRHRDIEGVTIPVLSQKTADGEQIHTIRVEEAVFNTGVMPWMFSRPAEAKSPAPPVKSADLQPVPSLESPQSVFSTDSVWDIEP